MGLVGPVDAVGVGQGLVFHALVKAVGEDLVQHTAPEKSRGGKILVVYRQLPGGAVLPGEVAVAVAVPEHLGVVLPQIKIVEVKPGERQTELHREPIGAVEGLDLLHGVVPGLVGIPPKAQTGLLHPHFLGDKQVDAHRLALPQGAEGGFAAGKLAVIEFGLFHQRFLLFQTG